MVNKNFDSIKMHGTTVEEEKKLRYIYTYFIN